MPSTAGGGQDRVFIGMQQGFGFGVAQERDASVCAMAGGHSPERQDPASPGTARATIGPGSEKFSR